MKVGILTYHSSYNFGANLQTLAVQELLRQRGCDAVVIDYRDPWRVEMYKSKVTPAQTETHERFIQEYLNTSPRFSRDDEVREYCNDELDVVVVGSDQVFRLLPRWAPKQVLRLLLTGQASSSWTQVDSRLPVYWLPWEKNEGRAPRRVAVSASACGTPYWWLGASLRRAAHCWLRDFDFVSVRDDWTRSMVRYLSKGEVDAELCPDPVFGLNSCFSVPKQEVPDMDVSKTILVSSALERGWLARFRSVAHDHGYTISNLPDPHDVLAFDESDFTIDLPLSPLAWYSLLSQAAGYLGSRFHGLVSAMANRTPAISLDVSNKPKLCKMKSRTYDLCRKAGARSRYKPVNWVARPSPAAVLKALFDDSSQAAMNRYAENARMRLDQIFDKSLTGVSGV